MGGALAAADLAVVTEIYAAREQPIAGSQRRAGGGRGAARRAPTSCSSRLGRRSRTRGAGAARARATCVLTLGAGDITQRGPRAGPSAARRDEAAAGLALGGAGAARGGSAVWFGGPVLLRQVGFFRVRRVELVGVRYLDAGGGRGGAAAPAAGQRLRRPRSADRGAGAGDAGRRGRAEVRRRLPGTLRGDGDGGASRWRWRRRQRPAARCSDARGQVLPFDPGASPRPTCRSPTRRIAAVAGCSARLQEIDPALLRRVVDGRARVRDDVVLELGGRRLLAPARRDGGGHSRGDGGGAGPRAGRAAHARSSTAGSPARSSSAGAGAHERLARSGSSPRSTSAPPRSVAVDRRGHRRCPRPAGHDPRASAWSGAPASAAAWCATSRRRPAPSPRRMKRRPADGRASRSGTVYCGIAGEHVAGRSSHGMVSVTGDEIRTSDVARVNDMASNVSFGRDHELLHAIPQDYLIDQQARHQRADRDDRLPARGRGVPGHGALERAAEPAEVRGAGRVPASASSCSSRWPPRSRCSPPDERELGLRHRRAGRRVHQRRRSSTAARSGTPASLLCAGGHVTADIVHGLQVTQHDAERLKERFGAAYEPLVPESDVIELPEHAGPGRAAARSAGCSRTSCTCGCRKCWSTRSTRSPAPGYHQRLARRCDPDRRRRAGPGHRGAGARGVRDAGAGAACRGRGSRGSGGQRRIAADGGAGRAGALRRAAGGARAAASAAARAASRRRWRSVLAPVKRWLQDFF